MVGFGEVDAGAFGEHQGLAAGHEVDEGQHVGDDLDDRGRAQGPHVDDLDADRPEDRGEPGGEVGIAAGEHGDLATGREVHAAGNRGLEGPNAAGRRQFGECPDVVPAKGGKLDPGGPPGQRLEDLGEDRPGCSRRGQAGQHRVAVTGERAGTRRPASAECQMPVGPALVPVVNDEIKPGPGEAGGEMAAELAQADKA